MMVVMWQPASVYICILFWNAALFNFRHIEFSDAVQLSCCDFLVCCSSWMCSDSDPYNCNVECLIGNPANSMCWRCVSKLADMAASKCKVYMMERNWNCYLSSLL